MAQAAVDPYAMVVDLIDTYNLRPQSFSLDQVKQLKSAADQLGINFSPKEDPSRMMKNALYGLGNTMTFGGLGVADWISGGSIKPDTLTAADQVSEATGDILGMIAPWGLAGKLTKGVPGVVSKIAKGEEVGLGRWVKGRLTAAEQAMWKASPKKLEAELAKTMAPSAAASAEREAAQKALNEAVAALETQKAKIGKLTGAARKTAEKKMASLDDAVKAAGTNLEAADQALKSSMTGMSKEEFLASIGTRAEGPKGWKAAQAALDKGKAGMKRGAEWLEADPNRIKQLQRVLRFGAMGALTRPLEDLAHGDLAAPIGRAFGGAAFGAVGAGAGQMLKSIGVMADRVGVQNAVRLAAGAIVAQMTAPEREQYPREYVEKVLTNAFIFYASGAGR